MELSELTPELFEKADFAERRRGYDIDQVERFLEETGTAVAQLLVRHRQLEERAAHADARVGEAESLIAMAEQRADAAEQRAADTPAPFAQMSEDEEIEKATSTLVMARRTADATLAEARAEADGLVAEARATSDRIVADADVHASSERRRVAETVEREMADGRRQIAETVLDLENRRDALLDLVGDLDARVAGYRAQIASVAGSLQAMVDDPDALGSQPTLAIPHAATGSTEIIDTRDEPTQSYELALEPDEELFVADRASTPDGSATVDVGGSQSDPLHEETISLTDLEPTTSQSSDRFLRELDEAVNEQSLDSSDEAMSAFFAEEEEAERPRFGWRR